MSDETKSILLNREVIAIDQDPLGKEGDRAYKTGPLEVWSKPLAGDAMAVALFNRTIAATRITMRLKDVGWHGSAVARDLWAHEDVGILSGEKTFVVPGHGVVMLRLARSK
jgi:alpha-galactosidase